MTAATPTLGRRERRTAETREAIVDAAAALFAERGYGDTTIEQIAERADIAPRTFFRYFPTKESVLFSDADAKLGAAIAALNDRPVDEHPFASLVAITRQLAERTAADIDAVIRRQELAAVHPAVAAYERTVLETRTAESVAAFVAERLGVDVDLDPRPRVWAALVMSTFRIALHVWLDRGRKGSLRASFDRALKAAGEAIGSLP